MHLQDKLSRQGGERIVQRMMMNLGLSSGSTEPPAFLSTPHSGLGLADRLFAQGDCCPAHPAGSMGRFWMGFLDRALLLLLLLDTLEKNV